MSSSSPPAPGAAAGLLGPGAQPNVAGAPTLFPGQAADPQQGKFVEANTTSYDEEGERPNSSDACGDAEIIASGGYVEDDWRLPKHNPLGRLAFGPPPNHQLEVLPFLQSVALRYKTDMRRLFKAYTHIHGHKTKHITKLTFDDEKRETDRMSLDGLLNLLKDFDLIAKQNSRTMEFYSPTALRWIRLGCLPAFCKHGNLPVSTEEVKIIVRRWQRKKERNGLREDQLRLEDMDVEGFVRCFARICILGFRRLEVTPSNLERNLWSTDAMEAFKEASVAPANRRKGRPWDEQRDVGFRSIVDTQANIWTSALEMRKRRQRSQGGTQEHLFRTTRHHLITAKIMHNYTCPVGAESLALNVAMSPDSYRDTNKLVQTLQKRDEEIHALFDELDTKRTGKVEKKMLLKAIQNDGVAQKLIHASAALAPLLHPQTYEDAFESIETQNEKYFTFHEFNTYIQSFEAEKAEDLLEKMVTQRNERKTTRRRDLRLVISKFQERASENIVTRKDIAYSLGDSETVALMKRASDALDLMSDISLHDYAIDVLIDDESEGLTYSNLCKFCEEFDAIQEHLARFEIATENLAVKSFGIRVQKIAAAKRAFKTIANCQGGVQGVGFTLRSLLDFNMNASEEDIELVKESSLAFSTLLKPASYRWCFSAMSTDSSIVTFQDFKTYCLSFEHRHARTKKLPLVEGDLVHLEEIREDGIWNRLSQWRGDARGRNKGFRVPENTWMKGELISLNRKRLGDEDPHYYGAFPASCIEVIKFEVPVMEKDEAAVYIQAMARGYVYRKKRALHWDASIPIQTLVRGFLVRRRISRGLRVREAVAKDMVEIAKEATTAPAIFESVLLRIGCGQESFHKRIQSKGKGFTFATGETPVVKDYRGHFHESRPANNTGPKYQTKRLEYVMSGMSSVDILRHFVVKNKVTERKLKSVMANKCQRKFRTADRKSWAYYYDDIWIVVNWVLNGNQMGSVLPKEDFEKNIIPRLDKTMSGAITQESIIKLLFDAEGVDEEVPTLKKSLKASAHAQKMWIGQHHPDDLEMTKKYGDVKYGNDYEKQVVDNIMGKYGKGVKMLFQYACNANHHQEYDTNMTFERHKRASQSCSWTNAQNMAHDLRLVAPRTRVYVHLDELGMKHHAIRQHGRVWNQDSDRTRQLPHAQFVRVEWIEDRSVVGSSSVPRLTEVGALPITIDEARNIFRKRVKRKMKGRHLDQVNGLVRPEELVLYLMDLAVKAMPRLRRCPDNVEREMSSPAAKEAYDLAYEHELEVNGGYEDGAVKKAAAAQKGIAKKRVGDFVAALSPQECLESLIWHINIASDDTAEIRRTLQAFGKGTFAYPVGFGMAEGPRGRGNTLGGPLQYLGKKTYHQVAKRTVTKNSPSAWIKRAIVNMAMESGTDLKYIFQKFDLDRNGTLEPHEIWHHFQQILPEGLGPREFNKIILAELYGIDSAEKRHKLSGGDLARLRVDYEAFEDFVMSSKSLTRTQGEVSVAADRGRPKRTRKQRKQDMLPPGPYSQSVVMKDDTMSMSRSSYQQYQRSQREKIKKKAKMPDRAGRQPSHTIQPSLSLQTSNAAQYNPEPGVQQGGNPLAQNSQQFSLLPGWFAATDPKTNMVYYYNPGSGERTWDWRKAISAAPPGKTLYTPRQTARRDVRMRNEGPQPPAGNRTSVHESPRVVRGNVVDPR
jgi:Ca2+-binding EF-hand superfamily protein